MKQTIDFYQFRNAFMDLRPNNFSYEGLTVLFDYLQDYEESTGVEVELDVISICCDFTESTIQEALECYELDSLEELMDNTLVMPIDEESIIYLDY